MNQRTYLIEELNAAKYNPRKMMESRSKEYENLKKSLTKFGTVIPIIVNERNNTVIGGHQRLNALKELGYKEVEAVTVDLGEIEEKQLNIALNKVEGRWDFQKLDELLATMTDKELEFTGFYDEEIETNKKASAEPKKEAATSGFDIYVSFGSLDSANEWLEEHGFEEKMEDGDSSITIRMEE